MPRGFGQLPLNTTRPTYRSLRRLSFSIHQSDSLERMPPRDFTAPGSDGDTTGNSPWKKGVVFTNRKGSAKYEAGDRIWVGIKRGMFPIRSLVGFRDLYNRVSLIGEQRVFELVSARTDLAKTAPIICHGWMLVGDGGRPTTRTGEAKMAGAFVMLELQTNSQSPPQGERRPTDGELSIPGGTSLEDIARAEPQRAVEAYNEFDFAGSANDLITVSFGQKITPSENGAYDFQRSVESAAEFARSYHSRLASLGEVQTTFQIARREWFLADPSFATVHIFFHGQTPE